jgi:hypothetical protein
MADKKVWTDADTRKWLAGPGEVVGPWQNVQPAAGIKGKPKAQVDEDLNFDPLASLANAQRMVSDNQQFLNRINAGNRDAGDAAGAKEQERLKGRTGFLAGVVDNIKEHPIRTARDVAGAAAIPVSMGAGVPALAAGGLLAAEGLNNAIQDPTAFNIGSAAIGALPVVGQGRGLLNEAVALKKEAEAVKGIRATFGAGDMGAFREGMPIIRGAKTTPERLRAAAKFVPEATAEAPAVVEQMPASMKGLFGSSEPAAAAKGARAARPAKIDPVAATMGKADPNVLASQRMIEGMTPKVPQPGNLGQIGVEAGAVRKPDALARGMAQGNSSNQAKAALGRLSSVPAATDSVAAGMGKNTDVAGKHIADGMGAAAKNPPQVPFASFPDELATFEPGMFETAAPKGFSINGTAPEAKMPPSAQALIMEDLPRAMQEMSHPGAQEFMNREFKANNPIFKELEKSGMFSGDRSTGVPKGQPGFPPGVQKVAPGVGGDEFAGVQPYGPGTKLTPEEAAAEDEFWNNIIAGMR